MSNYLIELGIIHTLLIFGYWLFLRNEQQYAKMRLYLIGATCASLIIPFLSIPQLFGGGVETIAAVAPLQALSIEGIPITPKETSFWNVQIFKWFYLAVSMIFLIKFVSSLLYLVLLDRRSRYEKFQHLYIRRVSGIKGSFSFLNRIFLSESIKGDQREYHTILKHEKAHVDLGHSYDILFFEIFRMLFWWLPGSWYLRREIKKIHEYQADKYALKTSNPEEYATILISSTLKLNGLALASSFHDGLITQRLKAMKSTVKTLRPWKIITLSSLATLLLVVFACNEEIDNEIQKIGHQSSIITFDQLPVDIQNSITEDSEDLVYVRINVLDQEDISKVPGLAEIDPETIQSINVYKEEKEGYVVIRKKGSNFNYLSEKSKTSDAEGEIFTIVEEQPEYPGGTDAFYRYISENILYPKEAREQGIEGRVYVQFTVDKDGSISDVETVKGIGGGCDEEAVRIIQNARKFNPGKQRGMPVRVRMVMPIAFNLKKVNNNESYGVIAIDKLQQNSNPLKVNASYDNGMWHGKVLSPEGDPLAGANVIVKGTSFGTISDIDGNFTLETSEAHDLVFSFVGYESITIKGK